MLSEFKKFISRGNVLDMAVGIIIGTAFGKIVSSFVADVLMPPIGLVMGRVDFSKLYLNLSNQSYSSLDEAKKAAAPTINYGRFLNTVIDFLLIAVAVFLLMKVVSHIKKKQEAAAPATKDCPYCFSKNLEPATRCASCTSDLKI